MAGPDFLIIGAMKCGTSTLAAQLGAQDGVFMTTPKEPNYFSDDAVYERGPDWYAALFAQADQGDLKGEASTHYTKLPTYPQTLSRMQALLPDPQLIYMIRDPMRRAESHYIHEWSEGRLGGDAEQAFAKCTEIIDYGCYGKQILPFAQAYGTENICLISLEQLKAEPEQTFLTVATFLGLHEGATWKHDLPAQNVSVERIRKLPMQDILIDNPVAQRLRRSLVPKSVRTWIRNRRKMTTRPEISENLGHRMQERFLQDRALLAGFFPDHPALDLCYPFAR